MGRACQLDGTARSPATCRRNDAAASRTDDAEARTNGIFARSSYSHACTSSVSRFFYPSSSGDAQETTLDHSQSRFAHAQSEVLDDDLLDALLEPARWFDRDAILPAAPGHAFRIEEGWSAMVKQGAGGAQVISFFLPGDLVGFDLATTPLIGAQLVALTPLRLRLSRAQSRQTIIQHPSLVRMIAAHNLAHHKRLHSQVFRLGAMSVFRLAKVALTQFWWWSAYAAPMTRA